MDIDTIIRENDKYKLVRRGYSKNDVVWFVVNKEREKSLVFGTKKQAVHVYSQMSRWEGLNWL